MHRRPTESNAGALRAGLLLLLLAAEPAALGANEEARQHFLGCASCHGDEGQGIRAKHAPRIAGQGAAYLERQLLAFREGWRGTHPADLAGRQMSLMAAPVADPSVRKALAQYLATLPGVAASRTVAGDATRGAALYATCAACHGAQAEGNVALDAPRLAGIDDWYLLLQLRNFRAGVRGSHPDDAPGGRMADQARALAGEQDLEDVVAHIANLTP